MATSPSREPGQQLLTAVERLLASDESLIARAEAVLAESELKGDERREAAAAGIVQQCATRAALSGALSATPALIPGVGTAVTLGATLADMAVVLKFEVEMCLMLAHLHGFDIRKPSERQLAFLLAAVGTHDAQTGSNPVLDAAVVQGVAIWNYSPRKVAKLLLEVLTILALIRFAPGLLRAVPLLGIAIGATVNRSLTARVGRRASQDLGVRRAILEREGRAEAKGTAAVRPKTRRAPRPAAVRRPR